MHPQVFERAFYERTFVSAVFSFDCSFLIYNISFVPCNSKAIAQVWFTMVSSFSDTNVM